MKEKQNDKYEFEINTGELLATLGESFATLVGAALGGSEVALSSAILPFVGIVSCISVHPARAKVLQKYIRNSLSRALGDVLKLIPKEKLNRLQNAQFKRKLKPSKQKIVMDRNLFSKPGSSAISKAYVDQICALLKDSEQDMTDEILQIRIAWPGFFSKAASKEWTSKREYYDELSNDSILGPMQEYLDAIDEEYSYKQEICKKLTDGLYDGSCSIEKIYVDLYATYQRECIDANETRTCWLEEDLVAWCNNGNPGMVVVEGDPGSGKSTVLKKVAKELICCGKHVIYVDLFKVPFSGKTSCFDTFKEYLNGLSWYIPLDISSSPDTVYILDGLDEIKCDVWSNAKELSEQLKLFSLQNHHKVILSGRLKIISHCENELSRLGKYTILPLVHTNPLIDQREILWEKLSAAYHLDISMGDLLKHDHLRELSESPLLLFLLAWTFDKDPTSLEKVSNSVQLYRLILKFVYERRHNRNEDQYAGSVRDFNSYLKILRAVGVCAWLHNSRSIEISHIKNYCVITGIEDEYNCWFEKEKKEQTSRLFLLFFAHETQSEKDESIFEFLHKSFYEFLALEEIIFQINQLHKLDRNAAVKRLWFLLCEQNTDSDTIFDFMNDLISESPEKFQLFSENLLYAFSLIEPGCFDLSVLPHHNSTQTKKVRTLKMLIEELNYLRTNLWKLVGYIFTTVNKNPSFADKNRFSFKGLKFSYQKIVIDRLPNADFSKCTFSSVSMPRTEIQNTSWNHAELYDCEFPGAVFEGSFFDGTRAFSCNFQTASLEKAKITGGNYDSDQFEASYLGMSSIQDAEFMRCEFTAANFDEAQISGCIFCKCYFDRADFTNADIMGCKFIGCDFSDALFSGVKLAGFDMNDPELVASLSKAQLDDADWEGITDETRELLLR